MMTWQAEKGRVSQTFTDAVRKWNMAVFTSAGNDGPALSSLGAPGHLTAPITVGAYISPPMMTDQYRWGHTLPSHHHTTPPSHRALCTGAHPHPPSSLSLYSMLQEPVDATSYSFSSRGPTPDGYLPTLCAPGGAIAPVPRHTLQGKAQYHGTSMSSPNACGVAACVLSALRQAGIEINPIELRRALENSATPVPTADPFAQGAGLINGPAAVAYATEHHGKPVRDRDVGGMDEYPPPSPPAL